MDFQASLNYLYGLQLFGVKLGLDNMWALQERLPLLQEPLPCVHVAGTNGKGSVSAFLAEILKHSGLRVGLYTSPHLHCFSERIRIDGAPIDPREIAQFAEIIRRSAGGIPVTFFEATTTMALLAFRQHQVDIAVVEVGLGGRLDATNIIDPQLCLITPVGLDHSEHLGDSLAEIAAEKAGIIKPGIPVVVGKQSPDATEVIMAASADCAAPVLLAGRDYFWQGDHDKLSIDVNDEHIGDLSCTLAGSHQLDNFAQAVTGALCLREQGVAITNAAIRKAGRTTIWPGRLEWFGETRRILLDVAHNSAGATCLADYLEAQEVPRIHLVVGLTGKRNPVDVLMPLAKFSAAVYAVPVSYEQSVSPTRLTDWAGMQGVPASEYASASKGLAAALESAGDMEPVVVCGSLYLVAELRQELLEGRLL